MRFPFFRKKKGVGEHTPHIWSIDDATINGDATSEKREAYKSLDELQQTAKVFNRVEYLDTKRAEIALKFVKWYLIYVLIVIIGVPLFNAFAVHNTEPIDVYKLLGQVGTLLGSPLGFVVGYYFKDDRESS